MSSRSHLRSSSNLGSQLGCRDASACCSSVTARLDRCGLRRALTATPSAPRTRDIPWPTLSLTVVRISCPDGQCTLSTSDSARARPNKLY